jgi:hypothetical protein
MKSGFWILALITVSLLGCKEQEEWSLEYKEALADLVKEVQIVEVAVNEVEPKKRDSIEKIYYGQFYEMHDLTEDSLEVVLNLLRMNPKLAEEIYKMASDLKNVK